MKPQTWWGWCLGWDFLWNEKSIK